ncbi:MAG: hypothetical protein SV186_00555 [Candidatus Nanohaloarchaea archaeon]|nr:hypothetical protein [Candidatus Nanohaloarchaea archaeon]
MPNYGTMLMEGPSRTGSDVVSLGELELQENYTSGELDLLAATEDLDQGFTYDELKDEAPHRSFPKQSGIVPYPDSVPISDDELQGYLGSLVQKGLIDSETYTEDEIKRLGELDDGLLKKDEVDEERYGDLLNDRGGIYTRDRHGVHVDEDTEPGVSHFYLTEEGKDVLDGL